MICALLLALALGADQPDRRAVGPGVYLPIYPAAIEETRIRIAAFTLDAAPVTRGEFLAFVTQVPQWRRDRVKRLFADPGYLEDWAGPLDPSAGSSQRPVTSVSWFAARAFCKWAHGKLPTEAQWELAAAADETQTDARRTPAFRAQLLAWYGRPNPPQLADVRAGKPNVWGVHDLHGLIWEWVLDFGNTRISAGQFCGAGATTASEKDDYAGFMRFAFRSALEARYTVGNLGFRCAGDAT